MNRRLVAGLGVAGLICKVIGAFFRIPLYNLLGDGMQYYEAVYPYYSTLLVISSAGLPTAISRMVAERTALGDYAGGKKVFRRSLLLLQANGVIKVKPEAGLKPSVADIIDNPKKLKIIEVEAAQAPRSLDDVDAASINTNYASQAGLTLNDAVLKEDAKGPYVNVIAVRSADKDKPWVKTLLEAYHTPEVKAFVVEKFKGAVLPSW